MDERSLSDMAARIAGVASSPPTDCLTEIVELVAACRKDLDEVAEGWIQGRLNEEAYRSMSANLASRARMAADVLRLSRKEMESLLSRTTTRKISRVREPAGAPESTA